MQKKALILLLVALLMGGVAVIMVNILLNKEVGKRDLVEAVSMQPVVVAAVDLKLGTRLDKLALKVVNLPSDTLPEGTFSSTDALLSEESPIVLRTIKENEMVLAYKLSPHGARGGLPPKIPEDMRAVTISVNEISGVAGFVLPGNYVDIMLTSDAENKPSKVDSRVYPRTLTLLQNVMVLGVDQMSSEDNDEPTIVNAVTVLISPDDGKKLTLAQRVGELKLLLRNEFDASIIENRLVDVKDLLVSEQKVTKPKVYKRVRRTPRPVVEVIRGLEIEKQRVKEGTPLPETTK